MKTWSVTFEDCYGGLHEIRRVKAKNMDEAQVKAEKRIKEIFTEKAQKELELEWVATEEE